MTLLTRRPSGQHVCNLCHAQTVHTVMLGVQLPPPVILRANPQESRKPLELDGPHCGTGTHSLHLNICLFMLCPLLHVCQQPNSSYMPCTIGIAAWLPLWPNIPNSLYLNRAPADQQLHAFGELSYTVHDALSLMYLLPLALVRRHASPHCFHSGGRADGGRRPPLGSRQAARLAGSPRQERLQPEPESVPNSGIGRPGAPWSTTCAGKTSHMQGPNPHHHKVSRV